METLASCTSELISEEMDQLGSLQILISSFECSLLSSLSSEFLEDRIHFGIIEISEQHLLFSFTEFCFWKC